MAARTMRGAVVRECGEPLSIEQVPIPEPGPGETQVRVGACGASHAWSLVLTREPSPV